MRRSHVVMALVSSLIVLALTLGAPAITSAQSGGAIYACVGRGSQLVRIVAATESCRSAETRVMLNVVGPQGPKGDPGPQGLQGDTGPQGPAGPGIAASADAITGTWSGRVFSVKKSQGLPYLRVTSTVPGGPAPYVSNNWTVPSNVTGVGCSQDGSSCSVWYDDTGKQIELVTKQPDPDPVHSTDPSFDQALVAMETSTITLQLTGSGPTVTGTAIDSGSGTAIASIDGIAVSDHFFLLRILAPSDPGCPATHLQAFASIRAGDPDRLNLTGSGGVGGSGCPPHHDLFSGGFRRQP